MTTLSESEHKLQMADMWQSDEPMPVSGYFLDCRLSTIPNCIVRFGKITTHQHGNISF